MSIPRDPPASASLGSGTRPGLTSLIHTGRGVMTVQTEISSDPAHLVSIVDYRGRVLKSWHSPFSVRYDDPELADIARAWHREIELRVHDILARGRVGAEHSKQLARGQVVAHLFIAAVRSYAALDFETARDLLTACATLSPGEPRIRAAVEHIQALTQSTSQSEVHE